MAVTPCNRFERRCCQVSSNRIETLIDEVQAAFDRQPIDIEDGLGTDEADVIQLRKSCRLLAGAETLLEQGFYTLVVEASFVAIERVIEFNPDGRATRRVPRFECACRTVHRVDSSRPRS